MHKSITETLKKINTELAGSTFLSIIITLILLTSFVAIKAYSQNGVSPERTINYQKSSFVYKNEVKNTHFIYASRIGKKYYYYNCKSTIKESNKIFFDSDEAALRAGYTLAAACK